MAGSDRSRKMRVARALRRRVTSLPLAAKANDLEALKKTVEDATSISGGLWLSGSLAGPFYIVIAAGAVTHIDLLLENPVKLPFLLNIELPLKAFFFLAPILFLVSHAYTLAHFRLLADKARRFHTELHKQLASGTRYGSARGAAGATTEQHFRPVSRWAEGGSGGAVRIAAQGDCLGSLSLSALCCCWCCCRHSSCPDQTSSSLGRTVSRCSSTSCSSGGFGARFLSGRGDFLRLPHLDEMGRAGGGGRFKLSCRDLLVDSRDLSWGVAGGPPSFIPHFSHEIGRAEMGVLGFIKGIVGMVHIDRTKIDARMGLCRRN